LKAAFIDTSAALAVLFGEPDGEGLGRFLNSLDRLFASNLLEAEIRAAFLREGINPRMASPFLSHVRWVLPDRPLTLELDALAGCGVVLRGADLWHVSCALYLAGDLRRLPFVTLDRTQAKAAEAMGFLVYPETMRGNSFGSVGVFKAEESSPRYRVRHRSKKEGSQKR